MLAIDKKVTSEFFHATLAGTIDEASDWDALFGPIQAKVLRVNCKSITRINSVGVKSWIRFFKSVCSSGTRVIFEELSPFLVEQFNVIESFSAGGEVESVLVPFQCEKCQFNLLATFTTEALIQKRGEVDSLPCPQCKGNAYFDDLPEEYFRFLRD